MSANTTYEAALERLYREQEEASRGAERLRGDIECIIEDTLTQIVNLYEDERIEISKRSALELLYEYATAELKRLIQEGWHD